MPLAESNPKQAEQPQCQDCNSVTHTTQACPFRKSDKPPASAVANFTSVARIFGINDQPASQDERCGGAAGSSARIGHANATAIGEAGLQALKEIIQEVVVSVQQGAGKQREGDLTERKKGRERSQPELEGEGGTSMGCQ